MNQFEQYRDRFRYVRLERDEQGVAVARFHSEGDSLLWGAGPHAEMGELFACLGSDPDNRVVILTGTGPDFTRIVPPSVKTRQSASSWDVVMRHADPLIMNHLGIGVPMIAAVNGPAPIHAELALLCDIVLASESVTFADEAHFSRGKVPGDGVHVVWPALLGINRARYFLMMGERIDAAEAQRLGLVGEVLPICDLMPRAMAIAEQFLRLPAATLRYSRLLLTLRLKRMMLEDLSTGLALEGLGKLCEFEEIDNQ